MTKLSEFKETLFNLFFTTIDILLRDKKYTTFELMDAAHHLITVTHLDDGCSPKELLHKYWDEVQMYIDTVPLSSRPDALTETYKLIEDTVNAALCHLLSTMKDWCSIDIPESGLDLSDSHIRAALAKDFLFHLSDIDNPFTVPTVSEETANATAALLSNQGVSEAVAALNKKEEARPQDNNYPRVFYGCCTDGFDYNE